MRLSKFLAHRGVCSRRQAEELIGLGQVSVDGVVITTQGTTVTGEETISVSGKPLPKEESPAIWIFNKPVSVITSRQDPEERPTIYDLLPNDLLRLVSVGRLDFNSEGLLLLTNYPPLAHYLEKPKHEVERCYRVRIFGMSPEKIRRAENSLVIDGVRYRPLKVEMGEKGKSSFWVTLTLTEGKNREIRRIIHYLGGSIDRLIRVSYGPFQLGDLRRGKLKKAPSKMVASILEKALAISGEISEDLDQL
ncbi:rRNA pseudouridine synthase [Alphaproteobacteria bacterium]|nr:rRNA pseudouridine synthase [Alphaproteobacteria bacterium]